MNKGYGLMPLTAGRLLAATTRMRRITDHLFNARIDGLLKVVDHRGKLVGSQPLVASRTNRRSPLKPVQRLVNRFSTARTVNAIFDSTGTVFFSFVSIIVEISP